MADDQAPLPGFSGTPVNVQTPAAPTSNPQTDAPPLPGFSGAPVGQTPPPSTAGPVSRFVSGAVQELNPLPAIKATAKAAFQPPQDAREMAIHYGAGDSGLVAYRAAKNLVDNAENMFTAKKEEFGKSAIDFSRAIHEFHTGDWRNALASTGSVIGDVNALNPAEPPGVGNRIRELSEGTRPGGDLATPVGKTAADIGMAALENAPEALKAVNKTAGKAAKAINETELRPEWLVKRPESPLPQHGTPVRVESPLDGPTVGKQLGGKDLSQEALDTLQNHVGDKIPVGGTAKNQLMSAVEPTVKTIEETANKVNDVINKAPEFAEPVLKDGKLTADIKDLKKNIPPSVRKALGEDVDAVMEDANDALNSTNPAQVLNYRRQLGKLIDWDKIENNPTTPAEVQNLARAKVYQAIGNKIHTDIPETVPLDKILQPNLELRSHMKSKLGPRVVEDPTTATTEAEGEFKKGKDTLDVAAHNQQVDKNWSRVKYALIGLGVGSGVINGIEKLLPK